MARLFVNVLFFGKQWNAGAASLSILALLLMASAPAFAQDTRSGALFGIGRNYIGGIIEGNIYTISYGPRLIRGAGVTGARAGQWQTLFFMDDATLWGMGSNSRGTLISGGEEVYLDPVLIKWNVADALVGRNGDTLILTQRGELEFAGPHVEDMSVRRVSRGSIEDVAKLAGEGWFIKEDGTLWSYGFDPESYPSSFVAEQQEPEVYNNISFMATLGSGLRWTRTYVKQDGSLWNEATKVADDVIDVAASNTHTLFITADGSLWGYGSNEYAQLGSGGDVPLGNPRRLANGIARCFAGEDYSLYITNEGELWGMGLGNWSVLGPLFGHNEPRLIAANVFTASAGVNNILFVSDGYPQIISVGGLPDEIRRGEGPFEITAFSSSGLPVQLHLYDVGDSRLEGNLLHIGELSGEIKIVATQPGGGGYAPADSIQFERPIKPRHVAFEPLVTFTEEPSYVNVIFRLANKDGSGYSIPERYSKSYPDLFDLLEDEVPVSSAESFTQIAKMADVPSTVRTVLLLDVSGSVGSHLKELRAAATAFVEQLPAQHEVALYTFAGNRALIQDFTSDKVALVEAIQRILPGGGSTDLYGTIIEGLSRWDEAYSFAGIETGYLVVFTDGFDQAGMATRDAAISKRDHEGKRIFAVGLGDGVDTESLEKLGNAGYRHIQEPAELTAAFANIRRIIASTGESIYWLNYASPKRSGGTHTLSVELAVGRYPRNQNTGPTATLNVNFSSSGFTEIDRGVVINRTVYDTDGLTDRLVVTPGGIIDLEGFTYLPIAAEDPEFDWAVADPSIAYIADEGGNASLFATRKEGVTTLTLTDTANTAIAIDLGLPADTYTRTIEVEVRNTDGCFFASWPDPECDGWVDTGTGFLGWIFAYNSGDSGWFYADSIQTLFYIGVSSGSGVWAYVPALAQSEASQDAGCFIAGIPDPECDGWVDTGAAFGWVYYGQSGAAGWVSAPVLNYKWFYISSTDSAGGWIFLPF